MLCQHSPSDSTIWHMSVKLQHFIPFMDSARALQMETHSVVTVSLLRIECARNLVPNLLKTVIRVRTSGLTESLPVSQTVQAQLLGDFGYRHRIRQFLLDGRKPALPHRASCPRSIAAVNDADQTVCSPEVLSSHGPDLVLAFHVPYGEMRNLVPAASIPITHILISVSPTTYSHTRARLFRPITSTKTGCPPQTTSSFGKTSARIILAFLG